jgi:hypothetical protein
VIIIGRHPGSWLNLQAAELARGEAAGRDKVRIKLKNRVCGLRAAAQFAGESHDRMQAGLSARIQASEDKMAVGFTLKNRCCVIRTVYKHLMHPDCPFLRLEGKGLMTV